MAPGCARLEIWGGRQNFRARSNPGRRLEWACSCGMQAVGTLASPACPTKVQGASGPGSGQGLSGSSQEGYSSEQGPWA